MPRNFNIAGPCRADFHYLLPPLPRLGPVRQLIDGANYFVVHAPRQVGKSTSALALGDALTAEGRYASVMLSVEAGVPFEGLHHAVPAILGAWRSRAHNRLPPDLRPPPWPDSDLATAFGEALEAWAQACPRPLVLFLDEVDALAPEVLSSLLRQLRDRYNDRPEGFPHAIGLVGMRDVKDYVVAAGGTGRTGAGSPFNILSGSLTLQPFTRQEIGELYAQHTAETGQAFTAAAVDRAWELTRGQPWLVNALAREATNVLVPDRDVPVDAAHIDEAKETLVRTRPHHLQSLGSRLEDPRVRRVLSGVLSGEASGPLPQEDVDYTCELGLVRFDDTHTLQIANPIYADALPRAIATGIQMQIPAVVPDWIRPTGGLDLYRLLDGFLTFWRRYGHPLIGASAYHEIAAQLVALAWLHRVSNGGGSVSPEFRVQSGRIDICLRKGGTTLGIELKVWREGRKDPLIEGISQLEGYLRGLGGAGEKVPGWLVIFDQRPGLPPVEERTTVETVVSPQGFEVAVVRA